MHKITEVDFVGTKNVLFELTDDASTLTVYPTYEISDDDGVLLGAGVRIHDTAGAQDVTLDVDHMRALAAFLTLSADRLEAGEHTITTKVAETIEKLRS